MAKVKTFKTIFPAVSVPLNDDYSINEPEFRAYLRWIKSFYGKGIEGLVCNGHTGEITGLTEGQLDAADVTVYHAGTAIKEGKLVTNGGRVLGVTATAATLPEALKKAYAASESIHFDKLHKRSDIGARALAAMQ